MRINGLNKVNQVYTNNLVNPVSQTKKTYGTDAVQLSREAKDMQIAKKAMKESPDIRMDKVEQLKQKMAQGTYYVSNQELADKIVESLFDTKI